MRQSIPLIMQKRFFVEDENHLLQFASQLAKQCQGGMVIGLKGELGAGKTTLVRGVLRSLGYTGRVKSPTYTLVESYLLPPWQIYHFDLYRITDPRELEEIGFSEYFTDDSICFIEWPEHGNDYIPRMSLQYLIEVPADGHGRWLTLM